MKKIPALIFKTAVSLALLALLLYQAEMDEIKRLATSVNSWFLAGGLTCVTVGVVLSSYKWKIILRVDGIHCPLATLVRFYLVGIFFNNFLPTSIGGDAARAYYVSRAFNNPSAGLSSILAERLSGLVVLVLFPVVAFYPSAVFIPHGLSGILLAGLAGLALLACFFLLPHVRRTSSRLMPQRFLIEVEKVNASLRRYLFDTRTLTIVILCSILFNALVILAAWFVAGALGLDLRILDMMVVVPLVVLLTLIPFSLNGLGIREGGFIFFLSDFGVSNAEAISFSLLNYLLILVLSVVGGVLLSLQRAR